MAKKDKTSLGGKLLAWLVGSAIEASEEHHEGGGMCPGCRVGELDECGSCSHCGAWTRV
jgi:hypothetical protein